MKHILLLGLFVLLSSSLFGDVVELSPDQALVDVTYFDEKNVTMQISLDKFERTVQQKDGVAYDNLFVDSWSRLREEGYPALPSIRKMVMVPKEGLVDVEITVIQSTEYENIIPYPAQPSAVDNDAFDTPPFTYDEQFYASQNTYPQKMYSISDVFTIRGLSFVYLTITPFQYHASKNILTVAEEFEISLNISGTYEFDDRLYSPYLSSIVMNNAINPVYEIPQRNQPKDVDGADLIIVTTYDFMDAAETLKEWKSQKGFYTDIAYLEEIGSASSNIYTYLFLAYEIWSLPPSFVIFLGDSDIVPTNYIPDQLSGGYLGSDRPYACMDGDYHPDFGYGRLSVDDEQQAFVVINKIIEYEKNPPTLPSFYEDVVNAGYFQDDEHDGYETRRFIKTSEEMRDFLLSESYNAERIYVTEGAVNPTNYNNGYYANGGPIPDELLRVNGFPWNGNATDITNAINNGVFMITHRDHGYTGGWGDPAYSTANIAQLVNGELLPMVFSINCQTGWFDSETDNVPGTFECFTEMFIRKEDGGAISTIGACRNSLSGYNDFLALGMIDGMWDNFLPNYNFNTNGYLGNVLYEGLIVMEHMWNPLQYEFDIFHVIGDPTIQIWREQPLEITATHDLGFTYDITFIPIIANIDEGIASLVVNGELVGKAEFTTSSFNLYLSESLSTPQTGTITITARDHQPYVQTVTFIPPNGSFVIIDDFSISDINGNADGEWDVGEEIILTYNMTNVGNEPVDSVDVEIDTDENYLDIAQPFTTITDLLPGESIIYSTDALISMNCTHNQRITLEAIVSNLSADFVDVHSFNVVKLPKIVLPVDSVYYEVTDDILVSIPFEIQNVGADTLLCTLFNHSHQCADITESNSYLTIPHVPEFENLSQLTLTMWVKLSQIAQPGFILNKGLINGDMSFTISMTNSSTLLYKFRDASGVDFQKIVSLDVELDEWFNLAIVVDETSITSYLNGELVDTDTFTSPIYSTDTDILVGSYVNSVFELNGYIDELGIYTEAFTQNELQDIICTTVRENTSALLSYYKFDMATEVMDYTGYNDAIPEGSVSFDDAGAPVMTWYGFGCSELVIEPYQNLSMDISFNTQGYDPQLFSSSMEIITNAENRNELLIPIELLYEPYSVDQNNTFSNLSFYYSNPFTSHDEIQFSLKTQQQISVDIYNLKGQFVTNLVDDMLLPRHYSYQWNGKDHSGRTVENGIYFIRIISEDSTNFKKMVFLR
ncbi:MAG: T9SS type A sorting domain-containing protein [Candidatus Cloacimonetes bacterium]|nr:T9SS type A sorting domain-containing protein [Candidatus Cloacimonadota bacterium]